MLKSKSLTCRVRRAIAVIALLALAPGTAVNAQQTLLPQQTDAGGAPVAASVPAARVSQRQALDLVRARYPGNVVSINEVQQGGALFYRVRMDNEGNIYTLYVDAMSGDITREQ